MTDALFKELDRIVAYAEKQFALKFLAGCFTEGRTDPAVPARAVGLSLLLGEVCHVPSLSPLEEATKLPQWQRWVGYPDRIRHDTFGYAGNRMNPEQLCQAGCFIHRKLKRGKAFEASKLHGLLVVSLDANEQFCSDHRCCEDCLTREITCKDAQGNEVKKTQSYHKQVYAQLSGPRLSVILDLEPTRPGEEECAAALRLLRRRRRNYGPRFFDLVVVDSWYTNGPFLNGGAAGAVVDKNHRFHDLPRLCHWAWQTFPLGQGNAAGTAQAYLPLAALRLAHSVLQRLSKTKQQTHNRAERPGDWAAAAKTAAVARKATLCLRVGDPDNHDAGRVAWKK